MPGYIDCKSLKNIGSIHTKLMIVVISGKERKGKEWDFRWM